MALTPTSSSPSILPSSLTVTHQRPWLGLSTFREEHRAYFFGRDREITEILDRIHENPLTILYGQSGLGKSSLLQAAVVPALREQGNMPLWLRLDYADTAPTLLEQTRSALFSLLPENALPPAPSLSLWEILHLLPLRLPLDAPPPILIFDQFEEIFTLGAQDTRREAQAAAWLEEIADLIQNRPPQALEERFTDNRRLSREYSFASLPLRIVFSLREDYLSHLESWKVRLPLLTQNRMALHLLNGPQALEAVLGPASLGEHPLCLAPVATEIIRTVADVPADTQLTAIKAVPPLLSLLCERLNAARLAAQLSTISSEMVSSQSADILQQFYLDAFAIFPETHREKIRNLVEDRLISASGHRLPLPMADAVEELRAQGVPDAENVFPQLVAHRLLTAEEHAGVPRLEVTHDVLVPLLVRSRKERRDRLAKEEAERKLAEENAKARRRRIISAAMASLALLAIAAAVYGFTSAREAARQRDEALYNEGLGWMLRAEVAEERKNQYPDTLLYAAHAIGYDGVGRPADAPAEQPMRFIRQDRNAAAYQRAAEWISSRPAYLPIWSTIATGDAIQQVKMSADGRYLVSVQASGTAKLYDFSQKTSPPKNLGDTVRSVDFAPWQHRLYLATAEGIVQRDLSTGKVEKLSPTVAAHLVISPEHTFIISAKDAEISVQEGEKTSRFSQDGGAIRSLAHSPDNSRAIALTENGVRVIFPSYAAPAYAWEKHPQPATAAAISPDASRIAIGNKEGELLFYDSLNAKELGRCAGESRHTAAILAIAFHPAGQQLATASADGTLRLWNVKENIPTVIATLRASSSPITALCYWPDGEFLTAAAADGSLRVWNVSGEKNLQPDLHHYLRQPWYAFASADLSLAWQGGDGWVNVPHQSLPSLLQSGSPLAEHFTSRVVWAAALTVAEKNSAFHDALLRDASAAARSYAYPRMQLRFAQLAAAGGDVDAARSGFTLSSRIAIPEKDFTSPHGIPMIWCQPGTFKMGSPEEEEGRYSYETQHQVTLTQGYWLAKTELTQQSWVKLMGENPSTRLKEGAEAMKYPVENISWDEALEFCRRLTDLERSRGSLPAGYAYTLPTEAQWEYACRAGTTTVYSFGDDPADLHKHGNYNDISGNFAGNDSKHDDRQEYVAAVGSYPANPWGFVDMHGNLYEWCLDSMNPEQADYSGDAQVDPLGVLGSHRVNRGGGFGNAARNCRSANRFASRPRTASTLWASAPQSPSSQNSAVKGAVATRKKERMRAVARVSESYVKIKQPAQRRKIFNQ